MLDLIFIFIFFSFPVLLLLVLRAAGMHLFTFHLTSFVILACLVFGYIGILPLYFGWDDYRYRSGVNDPELVFYVLLGSIWSIFSLVLGSVIAASVYGRRLKIPLNSQYVTRFFKLKVALILIVISLTLVDYLERVPEVAIFLAISGSISESARSLMGNDFGPGYHWYSLVMHSCSNFLVFVTLAAWLATKTKIIAILFWCSFCIAAFTSVMAIEKGPFVWLLIGILMVWLFDRHQGRIVFIRVVPFFVLGVLVLSVIYMSFEGSPSFFDALISAFSRAFSGSIQPAYHYLEFFPAQHEFLYGRSFPNPAGILPWEPYPLTVEVMTWIMGSDSGVVRSAPAIFWTELYANFGIFGVLFLPIFVGAALFIIQALIEKLPDGPVKVGYYVWVLLHFKNLAVSPFSMFLIDIYFFGVTMIVLFLFSQRRGQKFHKRIPFNKHA